MSAIANHPDLQVVIDAWEAMPLDVRASVVEMARPFLLRQKIPGSMVFTWGYSGRSPRLLKAWLDEDPDAVVCDIRLSPYSRIAEWRKPELAALLGDKYLHLGALGNVNYRSHDGPIVLKNDSEGISQVLELRQSGKRPLLLCQCLHFSGCHRRKVAELLRSRGITTRELLL